MRIAIKYSLFKGTKFLFKLHLHLLLYCPLCGVTLKTNYLWGICSIKKNTFTSILKPVIFHFWNLFLWREISKSSHNNITTILARYALHNFTFNLYFNVSRKLPVLKFS